MFIPNELAIFFVVFVIFSMEVRRRLYTTNPTSSRPAVVLWRVPWLGNAVAYGWNPHKFLENCLKRHGSAFTTLIAGRTITFILEPTLIAAMFRNSQSLEFGALRADVQRSAFATSHEGSVNPAIEGEVYPNAFRHFTKSSVSSITSIYSRHLLASLGPMHENHASTRPISLWNLVFPTIYRTSSKAIFGGSFPEATLPNFFEFDEGFTMLTSRIPSLFIRRYDTARTRVIAQLVQWSEAGASDPQVTSGTSQIIKDAVESMQRAKLHPFDIGTHLLSLLWGTQANTLWTSFWYLAFLLQDPNQILRLREEIQTVVNTRFDGHVEALADGDVDIFKPADFILLESGFRETMRLSSSSIIARQVIKDVSLSSRDGYHTQLIEGDTIFVTPRNIHMNAEIYTNPQSFQLDRFVADDGKSLRHFTMDGRLIPNHLLAWGGGTHMCKGIHIATYQVKLFVALVIYLFDIEMSHIENRVSGKVIPERSLPKFDERCVGVMHTDEDIMCHLARR